MEVALFGLRGPVAALTAWGREHRGFVGQGGEPGDAIADAGEVDAVVKGEQAGDVVEVLGAGGDALEDNQILGAGHRRADAAEAGDTARRERVVLEGGPPKEMPRSTPVGRWVTSKTRLARANAAAPSMRGSMSCLASASTRASTVIASGSTRPAMCTTAALSGAATTALGSSPLRTPLTLNGSRVACRSHHACRRRFGSTSRRSQSDQIGSAR